MQQENEFTNFELFTLKNHIIFTIFINKYILYRRFN